MFERNRVHNHQSEGASVPVEITTTEGETLNGRIHILTNQRLFDVLNGPNAFIEFEVFGGERSFLAKSALRNVKLIQVPAPINLVERARDGRDFDPYAVLGLPSGASFDDVKAAWHRLSKSYHPDRFASADLPQEVRDYLGVMARRVNVAYGTLEAPQKAQKQRAETQAKPIYTSGART